MARKTRTPRFAVDEVEKALREGKGFLSAAATALHKVTGKHCAVSTVHKYLGLHERLRVVRDEEMEKTKDYAEGMLLKKINDGDTACIIFFLKTRCKERGYTERVEQTHSGETVLRVKLPDGWGEGQFEQGEPVGDGG